MVAIRLGPEEIRYISLFELLTGASAKDCAIIGDSMGFLVEEGDMGLAIGKNGENVSKVRDKIGKEIFLMQASKDVIKFIKNLFYPAVVKNVRITETNTGKVAIVEVKRWDYKKALGENGRRIKLAKIFAERNFDISNILVKAV